MFEAFAIRFLQAAANVSRTAGLLGLLWDTAHRIVGAAVERGLERCETDNVQHVGIDEKSFGAGHSYFSALTAIDQSRVIEFARNRTITDSKQLWKTLTKPQLEQVQSVSLDMWQA
jgi:transposase